MPAWASTTASTSTTPLLKRLHFFKELGRSYSDLLEISNVDEFSWIPGETNPSLEREREVRFVVFTSSIIIKRRLREFHVVVVRWRQKMNKKVCCTCIVVVLLIKPTAFLTFLLPSPLSLPKLPNMVLRRRCHPIWTAVRETAGVLILFLFSKHTCHRVKLYVIILSNSKWPFLFFLVPQIS